MLDAQIQLPIPSQADPAGRLRILYNDYRTACLNKKYYGCRLQTTQHWNLGFEIIIALGATGTGIGGWTFFQQYPGVWALLAGASAVLALVKPIIQLSTKIERYGRLYGEFSKLSATLQTVVDEVRAAGTLSEDQYQIYKKAKGTFSELAKEDEPRPQRQLILRLQDEVDREIPPETLPMPTAKKQT
jgi:hypothetical protein